MILTIFTPTYNRVNQIPGLYESIAKAVFYVKFEDSVEWLIVDDGSEEDVKSVVDSFESMDNLKIRYIRKENGGKHTAYNVAIEECKGELFVCIDDDDRLTKNALADIFSLARKITKNIEYENCAGFVGRVTDKKGNKLGKNLKKFPIISNTIEIRDKYHFWGEPEVYFVKRIKKHKFDIFNGEKFLTEAYLFDTLTQKHPLIYMDIVMMEKNFLKGGLTENQLKIRINSPRGTEEYYYRRTKLCKGFFQKLKATINRQRFSYWLNNKPIRKSTLYENLARPISVIMYIKDKRQMGM